MPLPVGLVERFKLKQDNRVLRELFGGYPTAPMDFNSSAKYKYCSSCSYLYKNNNRNRYAFSFNVYQYPDLFDLSLIERYGWFSHGGKYKFNPNGITRDHKVSVNEAIKNNYDPYYIKHPLNCELMSFKENDKKKTQSSISYNDLIKIVNEYDQKWLHG